MKGMKWKVSGDLIFLFALFLLFVCLFICITQKSNTKRPKKKITPFYSQFTASYSQSP